VQCTSKCETQAFDVENDYVSNILGKAERRPRCLAASWRAVPGSAQCLATGPRNIPCTIRTRRWHAARHLDSTVQKSLQSRWECAVAWAHKRAVACEHI